MTTSSGKRSRDDGEEEGMVPRVPPAEIDDSSDEEIGPMPGAEDVASGSATQNGRKKKRRAGT
jgi:peptidylprolyl isomerase domain and WD repeat-containing protein 1